jgi:hypothetical protein
MAVFKIIGKVVKVLEGGALKEVLTKTFVRADNADRAELIALNLGFREMEVSYFGNNCTSLGDHAAYSADNNLGVMPGF